MSPRKREYLDDFVVNEKGEYEYQGTLWHWRSPEERTAYLREAWAALAGAAACAVAAGFIPVSAMGNAVYVLLPYLAVMGILLYMAFRLAKLTSEKDGLRDHVYQKVMVPLPGWLMVGCVAAFASAVGELLYLILASRMNPLALLYIVLLAGAGALLAYLRRRTNNLRFDVS